MEDQPEDLARHGIRIPSQPRVVTEALRALEADDAEPKRVARIIGRDPGLTALLFRLVRSARFAKGRAIDSLEQALIVVGLKPVANLVRALALHEAIEGERAYLDRFWSRSSEIALLASVIAEDRVAVCNIFPDQAYLAGIFHDCGVPLLVQRFPEYSAVLRDACTANRWASSLEEDRQFDVDHCVVGYWVARYWGLPGFVAEAIRYHHELDRLDDHHARTLVAILQLALHLYSRERGLDPQDWFKVREVVLDELGLHLDDLPEFADEVRERSRLQGLAA